MIKEITFIPKEKLEPIVEMIKENVGDYGKVKVGTPEHRPLYIINHTVFKKPELNSMTEEELAEYWDLMVQVTGNEMYGEEVEENHNSHCTLEGTEEGYLMLNTIELENKGKGHGSKILDYAINLAKEVGYKGFVIRNTENPIMNKMALKRGFKEAYHSDDEQTAFIQKVGMNRRRNLEVKYDNEEHLMGDYILEW